jgi:hypothetical protein
LQAIDAGSWVGLPPPIEPERRRTFSCRLAGRFNEGPLLKLQIGGIAMLPRISWANPMS